MKTTKAVMTPPAHVIVVPSHFTPPRVEVVACGSTDAGTVPPDPVCTSWLLPLKVLPCVVNGLTVGDPMDPQS